MMDAPPDPREAPGDDEFVVSYSKVDGPIAILFIVGFCAWLTTAGLLLMFTAVGGLLVWSGVSAGNAWVNDVPEDPATVLFGSVALFGLGACLTAMFGAAAVQFIVTWAKTLRGRWWIRMSSWGLEVNDRVLSPRRYAWGDIDEFVLGGAAMVGLRFSSHHHRPLVSRFWPFGGPWRDGDVKLDATIMGYWDRPFDEAVDLMNEWLSRHK